MVFSLKLLGDRSGRVEAYVCTKVEWRVQWGKLFRDACGGAQEI